MKYLYRCVLPICLVFTAVTVYAVDFTVTGAVVLEQDSPKHGKPQVGVVAWLKPLDHSSLTKKLSSEPHKFRLTQQDHEFHPQLMIVPVGSTIEFPNEDYLFHNVFSMFNGKRFDLGLYESGMSRRVSFDKEGVSYIFCNIHPQMSAVVVVLNTPYFATPNRDGELKISGVPAGRYQLNMWIQGASSETLANLTHEIVVNGDTSIGIVTAKVSPEVNLKHLNKYGVEYDAADDGSYPSR